MAMVQAPMQPPSLEDILRKGKRKGVGRHNWVDMNLSLEAYGTARWIAYASRAKTCISENSERLVTSCVVQSDGHEGSVRIEVNRSVIVELDRVVNSPIINLNCERICTRKIANLHLAASLCQYVQGR
jgi:hypothetical protein